MLTVCLSFACYAKVGNATPQSPRPALSFFPPHRTAAQNLSPQNPVLCRFAPQKVAAVIKEITYT